MKRHGMCVVGLVVFLAVSAQAAIPPVLPAIDLTVSPENPTSSDELSLMLSGNWPDSCVPEGFELNVLSGDSIWIDLLLPGWDTKGDCQDLVCLQVVTAWQRTRGVEPLSPGTYDVFLRAVACQEMSSYQQIGVLTVAPGGPLTSGRYQRGERVVLLEDDPPGGTGLKIGQAGTVVCCDPDGCSGNILISWDLWTGGKVDPFSCGDIVPALFPANSASWVDPGQVLIGRQFSQCGYIRKGLEGCIYFEADDGHTYNVLASSAMYLNLDGKGAIQFDDHVRLRGLLNTVAPAPGEIRICPQRDGDVYHPIITLCPLGGSDCCGGTYQVGDRVMLLAGNPVGPGGLPAPGLPVGSLGTVVCCDDDPLYPIVVSWDKWTSGGVDGVPCGSAVSYPAQSLWQMACGQIAPADDDGPGTGPGEIIIGVHGNALVLRRDSQNPGAYTGCIDLQLELNFRAQLSIEIVPAAGVSGNWSGTLSPDVVGPGIVTTQLCVQVENLDTGTLPPGNTQVATVTLFGVPAP